VSDTLTDKYRTEFKTLGIDRVRNELLLRRWPKDKLSAARQWVEREDVGDWLAKNRGAPTKKKPISKSKWFGYLLAAGGVIFAVVRLLRMMGRL
jgi:hypothetical protein